MIQLRSTLKRLFPEVIISSVILWSVLPTNLAAVLAEPVATTIAVDTTADNPTLFACTGSNHG
jgi:hypothetical protein